MKLSPKDIAKANIGFALVAFTMAIVEYFDKTTTRPTGRWSILFGPIYDSFGSLGISIWYVLVGLLLALIAFFKWRKS
jgi:uncharacterized membrane protein